MPTYSSDQFYREWRFSLNEDFHTHSGEQYPYAEDGSKQWGDEIHKIPYPDANGDNVSTFRVAALSHDGKYLAVANRCDIIVYDTDSYTLVHQLKGHVDDVGALAFRPGDSNYLVSSADNRSKGRSVGSVTYFWLLDKYQPQPLLDAQNTARISLAAVKSAVTEIETLSSSAITITPEDEKVLTASFEPHVSRLLSQKIVGKNSMLEGSIHQSFQGHAFSSSGHALFYLPPGVRRSNGYDEGWKLAVYSPDRHETMFMLAGHTDSIMWSGFNHDESLIGTCGWDQSIRIWSGLDGKQKYKFETEGQNWAGAFSPNGKFFVGTCGHGLIHVYDLSDGTEHMTFDSGKRWCRAVAWHPSSSWFAFGAQRGGRLELVDINKKISFQTRVVSTELSRVKDESRRLLDTWLELSKIHVVDGGRKIVFMVSGDGSAEIYDLEKQCKWRFARAGTMNAPDNDEPVTSKPGHSMKVWEDKKLGQVRIATIDGDAIRFWAVPLTK